MEEPLGEESCPSVVKTPCTYQCVVTANVNGRSVIAGHKARSKRRERVTRIHGAKKTAASRTCNHKEIRMTQKAIMTSRRKFLSNARGIAFVAALPFPAGQPRSTQGQSKASTSNSGRTTQKVSLSWDVFLSPSTPVITSDLAPGEKQRPWPPISSTLISGERDAVLVDTPTTVEQARALANWVVASGKNLTTIYATHGHGDHFFGTSTVLERFPGVRFVARPEVIRIMREQASAESLGTTLSRPDFQPSCNRRRAGRKRH